MEYHFQLLYHSNVEKRFQLNIMFGRRGWRIISMKYIKMCASNNNNNKINLACETRRTMIQEHDRFYRWLQFRLSVGYHYTHFAVKIVFVHYL